jgi:hypothetical protein
VGNFKENCLFVRLGVDERIKLKVRKSHSTMLLAHVLSLDESCLEKHLSILTHNTGFLRYLNNRFTVGNHLGIMNMETDS